MTVTVQKKVNCPEVREREELVDFVSRGELSKRVGYWICVDYLRACFLAWACRISRAHGRTLESSRTDNLRVEAEKEEYDFVKTIWAKESSTRRGGLGRESREFVRKRPCAIRRKCWE